MRGEIDAHDVACEKLVAENSSYRAPTAGGISEVHGAEVIAGRQRAARKPKVNRTSNRIQTDRALPRAVKLTTASREESRVLRRRPIDDAFARTRIERPPVWTPAVESDGKEDGSPSVLGERNTGDQAVRAVKIASLCRLCFGLWRYQASERGQPRQKSSWLAEYYHDYPYERH